MKTGVVRRVDELGRVLIPKEIRSKLGIKEGTPLEISANREGICFTPYCITEQIMEIAENINYADYDRDNWDKIQNNIDALKHIVKNLESLGV